MATSGSVNYATNRDTLIKYALLNVGGIGSGETPSATQYTEAAEFLNGIVKAWQADGMPLWALKRAYILPVSDTNEVSLGGTGGHATHTFVHTQVATAAASGASTLVVDSATGMTNGDYIGIELDDNSIQWTTINGAPSGATLTLTATLTDDVAVDNHVYTYTTKMHRPLRVIHAFTHDYGSGVDVPMYPLGVTDYYGLGYKTTESYPNQYAYDPQLTNGTFYLYPRFSDGTKIIQIRYQRPFEDFDATADEPDFPQEWYFALLWQLSWALCPSYGIPLQERKSFETEAARLKAEALGFGMEEASVQFTRAPSVEE